MRIREGRMARLKQAIDASPVRREVLREAYGWFKAFGELYEEDDHVAYEVVQQALRGGEERAPEDEARLTERVRKAKLAYHQRERPGEAWPPTVRGLLFDEALFEEPGNRKLARAVIATEVAYGGDVESPGFAARHGIPMYGSVALHVAGWDQTLVRPPYEHQAKCLLARYDNIRGQLDEQVDALNKALAAFRQDGQLPDDDVLMNAVLAHIELEALYGHKKGYDVAEVMEVLARVQRRDEKVAEAALRELCDMARAGRF